MRIENNLFPNKYFDKMNQIQLLREKLLHVSNYRYFNLKKAEIGYNHNKYFTYIK